MEGRQRPSRNRKRPSRLDSDEDEGFDEEMNYEGGKRRRHEGGKEERSMA